MFKDYSELCSVLEARLKKVQSVLKKGCVIGEAMIFDSSFGEIAVIIHSDMVWHNDDNRKKVHMQILGQTYKGSCISEVLYKFEQCF